MASKNLREGSAYMMVAGLSAASDWVVFLAMSWLLPNVHVVYAQGAARLTGGLVAFALHRLWTFKDQEGQGLGTEAGRFMALYIFSFTLSIFTIYMLVDVFGIGRVYSKAFADVLCFIVNFFVMKYYVFADAKNLADAAERLKQQRA